MTVPDKVLLIPTAVLGTILETPAAVVVDDSKLVMMMLEELLVDRVVVEPDDTEVRLEVLPVDVVDIEEFDPL